MVVRMVMLVSALSLVLFFGLAHAQCPQNIRIGQMFVHWGSEQGKRNMHQVDKEKGGGVYSQSISDCQSQSLSYSFQAARYGNTNMDTAFVRIKVVLDNGEEHFYDELIDAHAQDYSQIGQTLSKSTIKGNLSWNGKPKELVVFVLPGDWALELRRLEIIFQ